MKNKTIAYLGIITLTLTWIAFQVISITSPNMTFINAMFAVHVLFVCLATWRLWHNSKPLLIVLIVAMISYGTILTGNVGNFHFSEKNQTIFFLVTNIVCIIATIWTIVKLFKKNDKLTQR